MALSTNNTKALTNSGTVAAEWETPLCCLGEALPEMQILSVVFRPARNHSCLGDLTSGARRLVESRLPKEHAQASIASSFLDWAERKRTRVNADAPLPGTKRPDAWLHEEYCAV